jgi:hypothetical protein
MAVKLLDAVTSTGVSPSWRANCVNHTIAADITGSPTAVTIDLEGSLDNNTFYTLASHTFSSGELTAGGSMFHVESKMVKFIRANLVTLTGGSSPTVTTRYHSETS